MSEIQHVSDTAFMVAAWRAAETERSNPLFRDPLAAKLSGEHGQKILRGLNAKAFAGGWSVLIRTCVIDELILRAIADGTDLILNLGAGLDTRPYRMELPASLPWIEVDFPPVIELKETTLAGDRPRCKLERVKLDLSDGQARAKFFGAVAKRAKKVLVLTEGVIPYLTSEDVGALADDLRAHPQFAGWIVDYFSPQAYAYRKKNGLTDALKNAPFRFEPPDFHGFFRGHGWQTKEMRYLAEEGHRLGRPFPMPFLTRTWLRLIRPLVPKEKWDAMGRFMGYALLAPVVG